MKTFQYVVKDEVGLHARPAGLLVKFVNSLNSDVKIEFNSKSVSAKKLFAVMSLGVKHNNEITFVLDGANEEDDCAKLKEFCEKNV